MLALALTQLGAGFSKKKTKSTPPKVSETVGDLSFVVSRGEMKVEGVGLVVGLLNRTGVDTPNSVYRKQLVDGDEQGRRGKEPSKTAG